ncbi:plasmid replication protein RepC [Pseudosulfitobacter sp. DSM 107133]|uniref:plasmid replication protein RepC n=1 Tax=Pseudosulfitobacter sp. DSM 107133 TaxID=2883100 RepID=UPI000DF3CB73|nr:plasmid replication protein RepC [Pseudosulfitobacter sp. DSM 107133]UOA28885.1 plasmid replication protein RepC-3 [Pseudosulfitobacter sp. DSM 107133]
MDVFTTTPFGQRPLTAALVKRATEAQQPPSVAHIDKWALFRDLCAARQAFDVTDRDLTVLNALLSFHKAKSLSDNDNLVVYPSNRALGERAHGMAESTLRRHLSALSAAGLIQRHDSPNGKRYAARDRSGDVVRAFGFDLRPLLVRARQITHAAAEAHAAAERMRRLREEVSLTKRDALKLCLYAQENGLSGDWSEVEARLLVLHKAMRRKLSAQDLFELLEMAKEVLRHVHSMLETDNLSGNDRQNERHYQNSNPDSSDFEPRFEKARGERVARPEPDSEKPAVQSCPPALPLGLVLKACPDILPYAGDKITHWHQLVAVAGHVRGMMGITLDAWQHAQRDMGPEVAAITVAAILQRVSDISAPGGYLRALSRKAAEGTFSPGPMVMALLNRRAA